MRKILGLTLGATVLMMGYVEGMECLTQEQTENALKRQSRKDVRISNSRKKIVTHSESGPTTPPPAQKNALLPPTKGSPISVVPFPPAFQTGEQKELEVDREEYRDVLNSLYNAGISVKQAAQSILALAGQRTGWAQQCVEAACRRPFSEVNSKDPKIITAIARYIRPANADKKASTLCKSVQELYLFTRKAAILAHDLEKKIEEVAKAWGAFKAALFEDGQYNLVVGSYCYEVVRAMIEKLSETSLSLEVLPIKKGTKQQLCGLLASCIMTFDCSIKNG